MRFFTRPAKRLPLVAALILASASPASARLVEGVVAIERGNFPPAVRTALPAANHGDSEAQYKLGLIYHKGRDVEKDLSEAAMWWRRAAERGHANAQYNLGVLCFAGTGLRKDMAAAVLWWRKAAEQGHLEAQYNLGMIYSSGRGVPVDQREAAKWYRMAALQGGKRAQYNLGVLYAKGGSFPADYVQAHAWFSLAAESAPDDLREKAAHNRDVLASRLSPEQLDEAQRLIRELMTERN